MQFNGLAQKTMMATLLVSVVSMAQALTFEPFTEARFQSLQAANKPILVDINAKWCSTCKAQHEVLKTYQKTYPNSGITVLGVDFDDQKQWVTYFKAPRQSTFVSFKGTEQVGFSIAEKRESEIFKQLDALRTGMPTSNRATDNTPASAEEAPKQGFFQRLFQRS